MWRSSAIALNAPQMQLNLGIQASRKERTAQVRKVQHRADPSSMLVPPPVTPTICASCHFNLAKPSIKLNLIVEIIEDSIIKMTNYTVLVTGATGLLGRQVAAAFKLKSWTVKGTGYSRADGVDVLKVDLGNEDELIKALDQTKSVSRFYSLGIKHC
jgi:hypothetical protein